MSSEGWQTFGNIVNTAGITGLALTSAKFVTERYQAYASPCTSLAESERKLERVRSRLKGLSPQRREEIESQCRVSNCKSLKDLEEDLDLCVLLIMPSPFQIQIHDRVSSLMDTYYRLSKGCDKMTFMERHIPYSEFREHVRKLDDDTSVLFNDTLVKLLTYASPFDSNLIMSIVLQTTTVPHLDDMGFHLRTENPRLAVERLSTSESPKISSTPCDGALLYSCNILV